MNSYGRQPNIKLIPSDPMTNTILIIYCVAANGSSIPYKATWRRINSRTHKIQEIRYHTGSSYRCSPLDIDYFIEANIFYTHQNVQMNKIVQSNVVKVSRQLKQKRNLLKENIHTRILINEMQLEIKLVVHDQHLVISSTQQNYQTPTLSLLISQLAFETDANQLNFKIVFKKRVEEFLNFMATFTGTKPKIKNNQIVCSFASDLHRDLILLGVSEVINKPFKSQFPGRFPVTTRHMTENNGKSTSRNMVNNSRSPNRSQTSVSPKPDNRDRFPMKKSFTRGVVDTEKKHDQSFMSTVSQSKLEQKAKKQERECLNVFQDDQLELLNTPISPSPFQNANPRPKTQVTKTEEDNDGPAINLRGSFEQLQKSFNSNLNQEAIDKIFGVESNDANKKMQQELTRLRRQNQSLKKQTESIAFLTKENNSIKRKYLEMKQEVNRLEMERKVILTDKLRCQVNWHKEIQEKESLKRELEHLRQMVKSNCHGGNMQRSGRTTSFNQLSEYMH